MSDTCYPMLIASSNNVLKFSAPILIKNVQSLKKINISERREGYVTAYYVNFLYIFWIFFSLCSCYMLIMKCEDGCHGFRCILEWFGRVWDS